VEPSRWSEHTNSTMAAPHIIITHKLHYGGAAAARRAAPSLVLCSLPQRGSGAGSTVQSAGEAPLTPLSLRSPSLLPAQSTASRFHQPISRA